MAPETATPSFTLTLVKADDATAVDDDIVTDLFEAISRYRAGQHKAAARAMVDALNTLASEQDIYCGGWY